jgi:hypothetical protein
MSKTYSKLVAEAKQLGINFSLTRTSPSELARLIAEKKPDSYGALVSEYESRLGYFPYKDSSIYDVAKKLRISFDIRKDRPEDVARRINEQIGRQDLNESYQAGQQAEMSERKKAQDAPQATAAQIKRITPTTRQEFVASISGRQGYDVSTQYGGDTVSARKEGRQTIITNAGDIVRVKEGRRGATATAFGNLQPVTDKAIEERLKFPEDENVRRDDSGIIRSDKPDLFSEEEKAFERRVEATKQREESFFASEGFKNIEATAGFLVSPSSWWESIKRGKLTYVVGSDNKWNPQRIARETISGMMSFPIALGGGLVNVGEKIAATGEALYRPTLRAQVFPELKRAGVETVKTTYTDPATYTSAAFFAVVPAAVKYRAGYVGPFKGKLKAETIRTTYKGTELKVEKVTPVRKYSTVETLDDITIRKEGNFKIKYERERLSQKQRTNPDITVSETTIKQGGARYKVNTVKVGKTVSGSIRGLQGDISFTRTPQGKLRLRYLNKVDQFKYGSDAILKKTVEVANPESRLLSYLDLFGVKETTKRGLDIGTKHGGTVSYSLRNLEINRRYKIFSSKETFKGGRDIRQIIVGDAKLKLSQVDVATPQKEVITIGKSRTETYTPTDIQYALQPKYTASTKVYKTDIVGGNVVPITEYIKKPVLVTTKELTGRRTTIESYEVSNIRPIKTIAITGAEVVRRSIDMFKDTRGELYLGKPKLETIETIRPEIRFDVGKEFGTRLFQERELLRYKAETPVLKGTTIIKSYNEARIRNELRNEIKLPQISITPLRLETPQRNELQNELRTPTITRTPSRTRTRTDTRSLLRTETKTLTGYSIYNSTFPSFDVPTTTSPKVFLDFDYEKVNTSDFSKAFDVQIKRFGKYKTIAKSLPIGKATKELTGELKRTLAASGRLVPKGTTTQRDISFSAQPNEFRQYKIKKGQRFYDPYTFIQRRGFRLGSGSEVREIQQYKKISEGGF